MARRTSMARRKRPPRSTALISDAAGNPSSLTGATSVGTAAEGRSGAFSACEQSEFIYRRHTNETPCARRETPMASDPSGRPGFAKRRVTMPDHVYRIIEIAGSSEKSIEDAIHNAVGRASRTLRQIGWFEVVQTRGHVEDGKVAHYQVTLKIGFTLEDED